jgi:glycosyltransferase involved in cell wall biosynthesis
MGEPLSLPDELLSELRRLKHADILIGIPSFNNARTIGHVVKAVQAGLAKYFPGERCIVLNSDGGSKDGTPEVVRSASIDNYRTVLASHPLQPVHRIVTPYHGIPGKGSALRTVFAAAVELGAKACAVVDSDLRSITPEWIDLLITPVLQDDYDFVGPLYHRHKYDGTITNSIVYPVTRALYGTRVRQPIGGDFGLSGRLAAHYVAQDVWSTDVARFGIDIWMTTTAITGSFRVCQSFLGAKIHDVKDPGVDLSAMLVQVVSSVLSLMEGNETLWRSVTETRPVPTFGMEYAVGLEPIQVNVERMVGIFRTAANELGNVWERVLHPETFRAVRGLAALPTPEFRYPGPLWVRTIWDIAAAYHATVISRDHLLRALTPLYLGRTASFVLETPEASADDVEAILEGLCRDFETAKPYLVERWDSYPGGQS